MLSRRELLGMQIAASSGAVRPSGAGRWRVRSQSGTGSYRVTYSRDHGWECDCPDNMHCKHIYAVQHTREGSSETRTAAYRFDPDWVNGELADEYGLHVRPYRRRSRLGWQIVSDQDTFTLSEYEKPAQVTDPIGIIVDHALETRTRLYVEIDHAPRDYSDWVQPPRPLGPDKLIAILVDEFEFTILGRVGSITTLVYDPETVTDPHSGIPCGDDLRELLNQAERALSALGSRGGTSGFNARCDLHQFRRDRRAFLRKIRDALTR